MSDLVVFGDSVPWGQGLAEHEKFVFQLAGRLNLRLRMRAHSGARVVADAEAAPTAPPEVPHPNPSVSEQIERYRGDVAKASLILINGGVNDLKVTTLLSPLTSPETLRRRIHEICYQDMKTALELLIRKFSHPHTRILLLGYYPFFSRESSFSQIACFLTSWFIPVPASARSPILERIISNSQLFWTESTAMFRKVVAELGCGRLRLVELPFTDKNAMFTAESWLFNVYWVGDSVCAEDALAQERRVDADGFHESEIDRHLAYIASAGHPNLRGSQVHLETILRALNE